MIPHRPPMLWIDPAAPGGYKVLPDHPFLRDGVLPRTALIELLAQSAACVAAASESQKVIGQGRLAGVRGLRFFADVRAGDSLRFEVERLASFGKLWQARVAVFIGETLVVEGRMTFYVEFL